jgi:hypothetical protein
MVQSNRFRILAVAGCFVTASVLFVFLAANDQSNLDAYSGLLSGKTARGTESLDLVGVRGISDLVQGLGLGDQNTQSSESVHGLSQWRDNLGLDDSSTPQLAETRGHTAGGNDRWSKAAAAVNHFMDFNSVTLAQPKLPDIETSSSLPTMHSSLGL